MSCAECTRRGRPCVTSSVDRLDRVVEELSSKIKQDESGIEEAMNRVLALASEIEKLRQRIARNKVIREQNNKRLDEQLRHLVENGSSAELNSDLSQAVTLGRDITNIGLEDPFDWSFDVPSAVDSTVSGSSS